MTPAEPVPAWLSAWRERLGHHGPAQPTERPKPARRPRTGRNSPTVSQGFSEPAAWADDGGVRREAVLDVDHTPPRVVRRVGWHGCLRCRRRFFSQDVVRQRLCAGCRGDDDRFAE